MGRNGDGGTALQIVDIAVRPSYQGQGFGKCILQEIMSYIDRIAEQGTYVSLIADYPADQLYAHLVLLQLNRSLVACIRFIDTTARQTECILFVCQTTQLLTI